MAAIQSQSVNPSVGGGDGDAFDRQLQGWRYSRRMSRGARFRKAGGMVMFNEESDAKCVKKSVYNNPLDMWRNNAMEFPYLARVARHVLPIPATQAQSERMFSTAGLTVNKRRG